MIDSYTFFRVIEKNRQSKAKYAKDLSVGDIVMLKHRLFDDKQSFGVARTASYYQLLIRNRDAKGSLYDENEYTEAGEITQKNFVKFFKTTEDDRYKLITYGERKGEIIGPDDRIFTIQPFFPYDPRDNKGGSDNKDNNGNL